MSNHWKWIVRVSLFLLFSGVFSWMHTETTYASSKGVTGREVSTSLAQASSILGQITDKDGFPVKDAEVTITQKTGGTIVETVKTDSTGKFLFEITISGSTNFSIKAVAKGYLVESGGNSSNITLKPGDKKEVNLLLSEPFTLVGRITNESGNPIEGASIKIAIANKLVKTDKDGNYAITGIDIYPPKDVAVQIFATDYGSYLRYVTVSYGNTIKMNLILPDVSDVNGTVVDEDGRAISGAKVTIDNFQTTTDSQGKYSMKQLYPGRSTISVEAKDYLRQSIEVILVKGPNNKFDFILKKHLDKTPPVTKYTLVPLTEVSNGKQYINGFNFKLKATDEVNGSGLKMTQYRINGGEWITFTVPIKIYAPDVKTVEYFSTDVAGNQEKINKMDFVNGKYEGAGSYPY
ncbi:carboxypeptidase-like regulatory domain-containing protein [Paenibacillus taichungensis]|uniref:carboxypeptidase-like regulatory domain-containing protein n=1 Tax=Paenibacillus TaxID=44249 RepID=UPI00096DE6A6|nr:carboxypeptidase-like regulatory domain-containing protein [Paenibacillus taichungensis]MEC0109262.1 carboxypeptidase-like regulatory domain-containing protein [Paenibacillus taichungensis]MEC0198613.1 carboxypeptidase-like regulatory domain-containing protein [Paenibacillus taichungensis]OME81716.1 hypothetical protein BK122_13705 [Paenibacillus pabuli]